MGKDWQVRWDETIGYLQQYFPQKFNGMTLAEHIEWVLQHPVQAGPKDTKQLISGELSLGWRKGVDDDDPTYQKASKEKRQALRALLLCQRIYYSKLWSKRTMGPNSAPVPFDALSETPNWKQTSLTHWGAKTEKQIRAGIAMFVRDPTKTAADLAAVAFNGPPIGEKVTLAGHLTFSRDDPNPRGPAETCYNGVNAWLLHSGIVSARWITRDGAVNHPTACNAFYGQGKAVWDQTQIMMPHGVDYVDWIKTQAGKTAKDAVLKLLKPGYIYHLYCTESGVGGWNGHWVVLNADGKTISGVNNGPHEGLNVITKYTNHSPFMLQMSGYFHEGEKTDEDDKKVGSGKYPHPMVIAFNPLKLQDLI